MEIVHYPHPALSWKSKPISEINSRLYSIVDEMFDLMYEARGIGLAANQVALPYRLFVVNVTGDRGDKEQEFVFLNPEIIRRNGSVEGEEGCLSLPEVYGQVRRAERIVVEAFDLSGQEFQMELDDLPSRVVQHEADHLDGVMFFQRMSETARREMDDHLSDFEATFRQQQKDGVFPDDETLKRQLRELEPGE